MAKHRNPKTVPPPPTSKAKKPWDIPPFPSNGDTSLKTVYCAVGKALTDWERLDRELAVIFSLLVSGQTSHFAASRAYGSVVSVRGCIELVRNASAATFAEKPNRALRLRVEELLDEADSFSARRNDIAHGIASHYVTADGKAAGYVLGPGATATRKIKLTAAELCEAGKTPTLTAVYAYTSAEIEHFATQFSRLRYEAIFVRRALKKYIANPSTAFGDERFGRPTSPRKRE